MDSDDEIVFSESVQRKRTNLVIHSDLEEVSDTTESTVSRTSPDVSVPTTSTAIDSTQQQVGQTILVSATTTPKRNNRAAEKRQRSKKRRTVTDDAYSMIFSHLYFLHLSRYVHIFIMYNVHYIIYILDARCSYTITYLLFFFALVDRINICATY